VQRNKEPERLQYHRKQRQKEQYKELPFVAELQIDNNQLGSVEEGKMPPRVEQHKELLWWVQRNKEPEWLQIRRKQQRQEQNKYSLERELNMKT